MRRVSRLVPALALAVACASGGAGPGASGDGLWGYVRLVPREGVPTGGAGGAGYGDRRLRDVTLVDYDRPGFVVVYADGAPPPGDRADLVVREGVAAPAFHPALAAVGLGGGVTVRNATARALTLSSPRGGVRPLAAGDAVELVADAAGPLELFVLEAPSAHARVFVAPGPYAVASAAGRFDLGPLAPGRTRVVAWHPRFPPSERWVDVVAGPQRVDLEVGVGLDGASR